MTEPPPRTGLIRSVAHRLAGDPRELPDEGRLASFDGATGWLNSEPLTPESLRGRVVLVDFWTFTCVNWLRTLPYLRAWDEKYRDVGLTIVGAHTPEFGFEQDLNNVVARTKALGVQYPVAIDSGYGVWDAFANHYWPAVYLADGDGRIRYHHYGEGEYAQTEMAIQQLLMAGGANVDQELVMVEPTGLEVAANWRSLGSPETYLGYAQSTGFRSEDAAPSDQAHDYVAAFLGMSTNEWDLAGNWTYARDAAILNEPGGRIGFRFRARDVNLVMGPGTRGDSIPFRVYVDGEVSLDALGTDVDAGGGGVLKDQNTYQLIRQTGAVTDRLFEIEFLAAGAEVYCFTFG